VVDSTTPVVESLLKKKVPLVAADSGDLPQLVAALRKKQFPSVAAKPKKKALEKEYPSKDWDSDNLETDDDSDDDTSSPSNLDTVSTFQELNESALRILRRRVLTSQSHEAGIRETYNFQVKQMKIKTSYQFWKKFLPLLKIEFKEACNRRSPSPVKMDEDDRKRPAVQSGPAISPVIKKRKSKESKTMLDRSVSTKTNQKIPAKEGFSPQRPITYSDSSVELLEVVEGKGDESKKREPAKIVTNVTQSQDPVWRRCTGSR
jgi:hypothetical protein